MPFATLRHRLPSLTGETTIHKGAGESQSSGRNNTISLTPVPACHRHTSPAGHDSALPVHGVPRSGPIDAGRGSPTGGDHPTLGGTPTITLSPAVVAPRSVLVLFHHRRLEPLFDQPEDRTITDALGDNRQQLGMRDRVEGRHEMIRIEPLAKLASSDTFGAEVERVIGRLKDDWGGRMVRLCGHAMPRRCAT